MNSRNSINIILFLFVTILVAVLFYDSKESTVTTFNLSSLNESEINTIKITRRTSETLHFRKNNMQWYMTSPYKVRANLFYIESLLRIIKAKSTSQYSISTGDKNKYKLNPPQATLKLNTQLFQFGTNGTLNLNRYIYSNKTLFLLPDRYFYLLNIATTGYIDHALLTKDDIITGIKLPDLNIQLNNGKWDIKHSLKKITTDDIIQLVSNWNNSQTIEIIELKEMEMDSIKKQFRVELQLKNKSKPIIFDVSQNDDFYWFTRHDLKLQFKLNQEMANQLLKIPTQ